MNTRQLFTSTLVIALFLSAASYRTQAQEPAAKKGKNQTVAPQAGSSPVIGSGTPGRLSKWTGVFGTDTYTLGNSNVFEDKFGNVGIGTTTPTSKLTVAGVVESTNGGFKFPDGTVQTTSAAGALVTVAHDATLTGNGTQASPLGVASPLEVRDRDNPARQPVQFQLTDISGTFTVPAGKRLVVEYISGFYTRPTTATLQPNHSVSILTMLGSVLTNHVVLSYRIESFPPPTGFTTYHLGQVVKIYADPGTQVSIGSSFSNTAAISLSGHYVDVP